ncbi:hypothetical protein KCU64_g3120, partial [Aureobasidium melanogenum]
MSQQQLESNLQSLVSKPSNVQIRSCVQYNGVLNCATFLAYEALRKPEPGSALEIKQDFVGLTPLYDPGPDKAAVDIVAVPGLGTKAELTFRSKPREDMVCDDIWLRDYLPSYIKDARVLLYGYNSQVPNSNSAADYRDMASTLLQKLCLIREETNSATRPVILIGHSLGGILIKQMIQALFINRSKTTGEDEFYKSCKGFLFFGVPNRGLKNQALIDMSRGQSNSRLIVDLLLSDDGNPSQYLTNLHENFQGACLELKETFKAAGKFKLPDICVFYETEKSPTKVFGTGYTEHDRQRIAEAYAQANHEGDQVIENPVASPQNRLTTISVACIIANRMIGTGVFDAPTSILRDDRNIGSSLMLWLAGCFATLAGTLIYIEYGTTIPRYKFDHVARPRFVPRNGGELVYMNWIWHHPRFFAACLFGIPFCIIGNSAANAISFAYHLILAIRSGSDPSGWVVTGVAISAAVIVCAIHGTNRRYGIILNNIFATIKVLVLCTIVVLGCVVWGGSSLHGNSSDSSKMSCSVSSTAMDHTWMANLDHSSVFGKIKSPEDKVRSAGFAPAYLQVIFAFGGFNQANYVLGEMYKPHVYFRHTSLITVAVVCLLYMLVNVMFLVVVPVRGNPNSIYDLSQCKNWNIASEFFLLTCGSRTPYYAFLAFSSFGNMFVDTFTAARVKQEIAKEGILPWHRYIAKSYNVTHEISRRFSRSSKEKDKPDDSTSAPTPAVALMMHFFFATILILSVSGVKNPQDRYVILSNLYSYVINAFFAVCLAVGILLMRLTPPLKKLLAWHESDQSPPEIWNSISSMNQWVSIIAALLMATSNAFPLVASWTNQGLGSSNGIPSRLVPGLGVGLLGLGATWWLCFSKILARGRTREVTRKPMFTESPQDPDHPEMICEIITSQWVEPNSPRKRIGQSESGINLVQVSPK